MFTEIIFLSESKMKRIVLTISAILLIIYSGTIIYKQEVFQKVNNWFKIPDDELLAINIILNEKQENPKIFVPTEMVAHVRQIDTSVKLAYKRYPSGNYGDNAILQNLFENKVREAVVLLKKAKCDYLIWYKSLKINTDSYLELVSSTQNYNVYRLN